MIYEGKEYVEVTDGSAEIGDLIHVTDVSVEKCDLWCLTTDDDSRQPYVDIEIPGAYDCLDIDADIFTRYRYIKDVENNIEKAHRELNKTIIKIDKEMIKHLKKSKKAHDLINQTDIFNTPSLSENINDLFTEIKNIIVSKNENYGDSFSKQYRKYGMISVEMRLNDKFMRLEQLVAGEKDKVGESIEDTLKDIIGYATLALIELEGEK